jgi:hypothetical protein
MNGNYTIQANFAANTSTSYSLTTRTTSGGTVTVPSSSPTSYTSGTVATLTASPNPGYYFVNWTGLINTVANTKSASTTVVMNGNYVIQANFTAFKVTITKPGSQPVLAWPHQVASVDHYAVYRSLTAPYFTPSGDSRLPGDVTPVSPQTTFPDPDANLAAAGNTYYYVVAPMNASGAPLGSSNRTGAFVFGLTPGN